MGDEITTRLRVVGHVRLHHLPTPQVPIGNHPAPGHRVSIQRVSPAQDGEVCQADFIRVPVHQSRHAEVAGVDRVLGYVQLKVSPIVQFRPLKLAVVAN